MNEYSDREEKALSFCWMPADKQKAQRENHQEC